MEGGNETNLKVWTVLEPAVLDWVVCKFTCGKLYISNVSESLEVLMMC